MALNSSTSACTAGSSLCASIGRVTGVTATVRSPARIASSPATRPVRQLSLRLVSRWVSSARTGSSAGEAVGAERRRKDTPTSSAAARGWRSKLARRHSQLSASGVTEKYAHQGDERAAERDLDERLAQGDLLEALADDRDQQQLATDHGIGDGQRGVDVGRQERERMGEPADERRRARDEPARRRRAAAGERAVVRQALREAHGDGRAEGGGHADEQRGARAGDIGGGEDRGQRGDRAVYKADQRRLDDAQLEAARIEALEAADDGGGRHGISQTNGYMYRFPIASLPYLVVLT